MRSVEQLVRRLDAYQQRRPALSVFVAVLKKFGDDRAGSLAALIAYYAFFALFPLLLVLTTILGYVLGNDPELRRAVLQSALSDFPIIGDQIADALRPLQASGVGLVIGLAGLVWGAMGVTQVTQHAMSEVWNIPGVVRPGFVTRLLRGVGMIGLLGLGVLATTALAWLATFGETPGASKVLGTLGSLFLNIALYLLAFRLLTVRRVPTRQLVLGALVGGVGWTLLQALGGYLVGRQLRHASQVYGYFGSVIGLVSWLYLGAQLTLYAAELNVVVARRLWPRSIVQPPLTGADKKTLDLIALEEERRPEQTVEVTWDDAADSAENPDLVQRESGREPR